MKKYKRKIISFSIIGLIGLISNCLVRNTSIASFSIFDANNLFTYFGVLIGFALTIYTFGLSMVSDLKSKIDLSKKYDAEKKASLYHKLISGFSEIKSDIWMIFYSIIAVIFFAIASEIPCPISFGVVKFRIPETVNLTLFISTTIAMWDIMQTLFNLAEINLELNKD